MQRSNARRAADRRPELRRLAEPGFDLLALRLSLGEQVATVPRGRAAAFDRPRLRPLLGAAGNYPAVGHAHTCGPSPAFRAAVEGLACLLDDHIDRLQAVTGEPSRANSRLQARSVSAYDVI